MTMQKFASGAVRDAELERGAYELLPSGIHRLALLFQRGAKHYAPRNWEKGIPFSRMMQSLLRHAFKYLWGYRDEDHLAAVAWNALCLMSYEDWILDGTLPKELDDLPRRQSSCTTGVTECLSTRGDNRPTV